MVLLSDIDRTESTVSRLVEDLVLLNSLGIRLVLVQSTRAAIDWHIQMEKLASSYHGHRRITDEILLERIINLSGQNEQRIYGPDNSDYTGI